MRRELLNFYVKVKRFRNYSWCVQSLHIFTWKHFAKGYIFKIMGAFNYARSFGNFGWEINGMLWYPWKFSGQSDLRPLEVVLFDRPVPYDQKLLLHLQKNSFAVPVHRDVIKILDDRQMKCFDPVANFASFKQCCSLRVVTKFWSTWLSCQSKWPVQGYFIYKKPSIKKCQAE